MITFPTLTPTNATTDLAADGSLFVRAASSYGPGRVIEFNLTGVWLPSNIVTGVQTPPGVGFIYQATLNNIPAGNWILHARVRATDSSAWEYAYAPYTIGFDAADCSTLVMGTINGTGPTTGGGSDGTITVTGVTAKFPIEYKLDGGAWQNGNSWTGLSAGTHTVHVRYKAPYTSCEVTGTYEMADMVTCTLAIASVTVAHESARFANDGTATVNITGGTAPIQYSKDDGANWQDGNFFGGLLPDDYVIKVKDANNCVDTRTITVYKFKAAWFEWPLPNSNRMIVTSGPVKDNLPQNFDNTLFKDLRFIGQSIPEKYYEKFLSSANYNLQWRSSYSTQAVKVYKEDNTLQTTIPAVKVKSFMNQTGTSSATLANAGAGKVQIFFSDLLPDFAIVGQPITLSGATFTGLNGDYIIEDITSGTLAASGYVVLIISAAWPGGAPSLVGKTITAVYDQLPYDVYEINLNWGDYGNGNYYLKLEGSDPQLVSMATQSEPIQIAASFGSSHTPEFVKFEFSNIENAYKMFYETGIVNQVTAEADLQPGDLGGEVTVMDDSERRVLKLNEYVTRIANLTTDAIPAYLAERLTLMFAHDIILVNGIQYATTDKPTIERNTDDNLCLFKAKLRAVNFIAENGDDGGTIDNPATVLMVNGVLMKLNP